MTVSHYSFWLIPQEPELSTYQGLINQLADRFGTVPFCPHVTLYSGPAEVGTALPSVPPIVLDVVKPAHTAHFAKTLYIQLALSSALEQLVERLVAFLPKVQPPPLDPHLSLLYHRLEPAAQVQLSDTLVLPSSVIRFNQIQVIAAPKNFETQAHVASLRCVRRQLLTPP
ncbi:MAG: hypothetical protein AAF282_10895 [Cyanobacteria bacterium P01_A01_bin.15]